jgi:hypothetical protein
MVLSLVFTHVHKDSAANISSARIHAYMQTCMHSPQWRAALRRASRGGCAAFFSCVNPRVMPEEGYEDAEAASALLKAATNQVKACVCVCMLCSRLQASAGKGKRKVSEALMYA